MWRRDNVLNILGGVFIRTILTTEEKVQNLLNELLRVDIITNFQLVKDAYIKNKFFKILTYLFFKRATDIEER